MANTDWVWTPAKVDELTQLWADGFSASQIAARMGNITRSCVLGKVNRLGLPRRIDPTAPRPKYAQVRKPNPTKSRAYHKARRPADVRRPPRPPVMPPEPIAFTAHVWEPLPGSSPVTLEHVTGCRWPVSDPFAPAGSIDLFCNCVAEAGKSYCTEHFARSIGDGTKSEQLAVKVGASIARLEMRRGEQAAERRWDRAA